MAGCSDPSELLATQKQLRVQLLDLQSAISWRQGRELAAQLLLLLDDPDAGWQFAADWLRDAFDVERVDGGFSSPDELTYVPAKAEARSGKLDVPSLRGVHIDNRDPAVIRLWASARPIVFADVSQEKLFRTDLRQSLLAAGTHSKMAVALQYQGHRFGLLCIDHVAQRCDWSSTQYERFDSVSREVLGPILLASARMKMSDLDHGCMAGDRAVRSRLQILSPAEIRVARLAAAGMSYKEIARSLNRSFSTVDHQLRSIRQKLDVRSNSRLVKMLSEQGLDSLIVNDRESSL